MKAEVLKYFNLYEELVEAGNNATLMFSSLGGKSTIKLQLESPSPSPPSTATTTTLPPAPGRRRRHRGAAARARRRQRAADHQASLAEAATSVPLVPPAPGEDSAPAGPHLPLVLPFPPPPLRHPPRLLQTPSPSSGRRRVVSVGRLPTTSFASLNLDGPPPSPSLPPSPPPPPSTFRWPPSPPPPPPPYTPPTPTVRVVPNFHWKTGAVGYRDPWSYWLPAWARWWQGVALDESLGT